MKEKIGQIIFNEFKEKVISIQEIIGFGTVNKVYEIKGNQSDYIIRINEDINQIIEYKKEKWCLEEVIKLGIKSPKVLKIGVSFEVSYMIQEKIEGINGKLCSSKEKEEIWHTLGIYAKKYQKIKRIKVEEVERNEFHKNWKARLDYNIKELHSEDSLLKKGVLNKNEQKSAKAIIGKLKNKDLKEGLVHGDLCPRNVIWAKGEVYLLDWGTAVINVIPHNEIGILLLSEEANETEFQSFLKGFGINEKDYKTIENEIHTLNLLHRLDKYRWAEAYDLENIERYETKVKNTFETISRLNKATSPTK